MRVLAFAAAVGSASIVLAQGGNEHAAHRGGPVLFLGRADGAQVVPRQSSAATATAAVILDRDKGEIRYDITFNGLGRGPATRVALYNFGAGGTGATVAILCGGSGAPACPERPAARLAGTTALRITNHLASEFASGRIYVQVDGGDGRPEIRGQLGTNGAMVPVRNYVAALSPSATPGASGEGTAVLFETYLPDGQVGVEYSVTVAGTSGKPEAAALVGVAGQGDARRAQFVKSAGLRNADRLLRAAALNGGSLNGRYIARRADPSAVFPEKLIQATQAPALSVRTSRFPRGEVAGRFVPVP